MAALEILFDILFSSPLSVGMGWLGAAGWVGCSVGGFCASGFFNALQPANSAAPKTTAANQATSFTGFFIFQPSFPFHGYYLKCG
jgi:hypothetical protein